MNPMEMLSKNVKAFSISSALATFLQEETWKCHQERSFSMTVQPAHSGHMLPSFQWELLDHSPNTPDHA